MEMYLLYRRRKHPSGEMRRQYVKSISAFKNKYPYNGQEWANKLHYTWDYTDACAHPEWRWNSVACQCVDKGVTRRSHRRTSAIVQLDLSELAA